MESNYEVQVSREHCSTRKRKVKSLYPAHDSKRNRIIYEYKKKKQVTKIKEKTEHEAKKKMHIKNHENNIRQKRHCINISTPTQEKKKGGRRERNCAASFVDHE